MKTPTKKKRLTYPIWNYKSRKSYVAVKKRQTKIAWNAISTLLFGCDWLPKKVKDKIMDVSIDMDFIYDEIEKLNEKTKP